RGDGHRRDRGLRHGPQDGAPPRRGGRGGRRGAGGDLRRGGGGRHVDPVRTCRPARRGALRPVVPVAVLPASPLLHGQGEFGLPLVPLAAFVASLGRDGHWFLRLADRADAVLGLQPRGFGGGGRGRAR